MLDLMDESCWFHDLDIDSSYNEIKEEFDIMNDELSDDSDMFPNGRDYDAEDEDFL